MTGETPSPATAPMSAAARGRPHFTVNVREQAENSLQGLGRVRHYTCNSLTTFCNPGGVLLESGS